MSTSFKASHLFSNRLLLLGMLILIVIAGYTLAAASVKSSDLMKRQREQELLKVGDTLRIATDNYYNQSPGWGLLEAPSGGVLGIYSLSSEKSFKTRGFKKEYAYFENQKSYGEWFFAYVPNM